MDLPPVPPKPRTAFVTSLGWTGIAGGVLGAVVGLFQWVAAGPFAEQGFIDIVAQLKRYAALSIGGSIPLIWVSWGILLRREWARRGMLALIAAAVVSHLALLPTLHEAFSAAGELPPDSLPAAIVGGLKWMAYGGLALSTVVLFWIGRKIARSPVRDEFS
jgi:hypothetical protein